LNRWDLDGGTVTILHMLPSMIYRFEGAHYSVMHPYLGFGAGVAVTLSDNNVSPLALGLHGGDTGTHFEFLVRPGVDIGGNEGVRFNVEPKLGYVGAVFTFMPQLGLSVAF
jgi:hypothetical protein